MYTLFGLLTVTLLTLPFYSLARGEERHPPERHEMQQHHEVNKYHPNIHHDYRRPVGAYENRSNNYVPVPVPQSTDVVPVPVNTDDSNNSYQNQIVDSGVFISPKGGSGVFNDRRSSISDDRLQRYNQNPYLNRYSRYQDYYRDNYRHAYRKHRDRDKRDNYPYVIENYYYRDSAYPYRTTYPAYQTYYDYDTYTPVRTTYPAYQNVYYDYDNYIPPPSAEYYNNITNPSPSQLRAKYNR